MLPAVIISLITTIASLVIEYSTLTPRRGLLTHIFLRILSPIVILGTSFLLNRLGIDHPFFLYLLGSLQLLVCFYLFKETVAQKTFLFFTSWSLTSALSSLCGWTAAWLAPQELQFLLRVLLYGGSYMILLPLYVLVWSRHLKEVLALFNKGKPFYALFPVVAFILFVLLFGPMNKAEALAWFGAMVLFITFIIFTYYLMISHFHVLIQQWKSETRLGELRRQQVLEKLYYDEVDRSLRLQRQRLHDTRHHLLALAALVNHRDFDGMEEQVGGLLHYYENLETQRYCENTLANAVIGGYLQRAQEQGIVVTTELDLPQNIGINEYDLCTLLGNTLENAIEACMRIPQESPQYENRFIIMKARREKAHLILRIENPFHSESTQGIAMLSSKGPEGGVGLESVRSVVDQYQGALTFEAQDQVFVLSAVLCQRL